MARLRKRREKWWFARIQWRDEYKQKQEKEVPLRTTSEAVALDFVLKGTCFSFLCPFTHHWILAYQTPLRFLSVAITNSLNAELYSEGLCESG
jgi:hypothetical protein